MMVVSMVVVSMAVASMAIVSMVVARRERESFSWLDGGEAVCCHPRGLHYRGLMVF